MDQGTHKADPLIAWASDALRDVAAERRRQIEVEGRTPDHDDEHGAGEMAQAAAAYADDGACRLQGAPDDIVAGPGDPPEPWPWDECWWKPDEPRRMLVKAAALLLAEIERLDRHEPANVRAGKERR